MSVGVCWEEAGRRGAGPGRLVRGAPQGTASHAGRFHTELFSPVIFKVWSAGRQHQPYLGT